MIPGRDGYQGLPNRVTRRLGKKKSTFQARMGVKISKARGVSRTGFDASLVEVIFEKDDGVS